MKGRIDSSVLGKKIGLDSIGDVVGRNRLGWFGHMETNGEDDWVEKCLMVEEGRRPVRRPNMTRTSARE